LLDVESESVIALGQRTDIPELMQIMDVFVLSSLGEAFPNVVAEAMASGVPCVVTDVGDAADIVGDTGWVVPSGDVEALGKAMMTALAESIEDRAVRAAAARRRVEQNFTIERMVEAYEKVWSDVQGQR
jgi:glycosyltransferase involved in cell wall biosynthesis